MQLRLDYLPLQVLSRTPYRGVRG